MSPTLIFKDGRPVYGIGSPGGATIVTNVFQTIVNLLDHRMSLSEAIAKPKLHHQYLPDVLRFQKDYPELTLNALRKMGHVLQGPQEWGNLQGIQIDWDSKTILGASDPRGDGVAKILQAP
jgi:gamma-glutamyltranspeptidase/glutathione hydrolase